jgi:hypothetical protein
MELMDSRLPACVESHHWPAAWKLLAAEIRFNICGERAAVGHFDTKEGLAKVEVLREALKATKPEPRYGFQVEFVLLN